MSDRSVSVALCTFNGARYLNAQLASLARQTRPPDELVVCDDRSTDGTMELLELFAQTAPFPVKIAVNGKRLGPATNFGRAAALCEGQVIFFCDQDDVWCEDKIEVVLSFIGRAEEQYGEETPILAYSDLEVVDDELRLVHPSYFNLMGFGNKTQGTVDLLNRNVVTGCAAAANRALIELALPMPPAVKMHDWWFALCASARGAIVPLDAALVRYRQHGANQIGARPFARRLADACRNPLHQWRNSMKSFRENIAQAKALATHLAERSGAESKPITAVAAYASILEIPRWSRMKTVIRWRFGRYSKAGVAWFLLKSLFA